MAPPPPLKAEPLGQHLSPMDNIPPFGPVGPRIKPEEHEAPTLSDRFADWPGPKTQAEPKSEAHAVQTKYLQQLISRTEPELLEKGVGVGIELLDGIKATLEASSPADGTEAARWIKAIDDLRARPKQGRTIVGVVGNTGAGKSSVINALLDEERLLPTSCLRACTASATEVSYNDSDDPAQLYRAEIEFITSDDWLRELKGLLDDLIDGSGKVSKECSNSDTDAGRAYAKIKAVYPRLTKEMIEQSDADILARDVTVRHVLGSVKKFRSTEASTMYRQLQNYVDSKEKTASAGQSMEYWPLIKVVRIYTKAAALSTGAVIVDLPGVQDSNAARAAVAANYMKQCSGLWIVAPITRAVDDKTAKKLLGDEFKRQLKYDGTYSSVTFICSKTDDISITEASDSLGFDDELRDDWAEIDSINDTSKQLALRIKDLKDQKAAFAEMLNEVEDEIDLWDDLDKKLANGRIVYPPPTDGGKKRKRETKPSGSRKNRISIDIDSDSEDSVLSGSESLSGSDKENGTPAKKENRMPLTEDQIEEKLATLKTQKKGLRQNRKETDEKIVEMRQEIKEMHLQKQKIEARIKSMCIKGRNSYSRGAIKQDFASGIKDLDQETAMQLDEANFDPEQDLRDYDKVAESLPVFCVSSRAYQQLRGRLKKDNFNNDGFKTPEDTEVPQLQEHARKMTEAGRALNSRVLLNDISQLLNSMRLWADNDGTAQFTKSDNDAEHARLTEHLAQLDRNLQHCIDECVNSLKEELADNIFDAFGRTIPLAAAAAIPTAESWASNMRWATYKATVRRNGVYAGAAGPHDFQKELWAPVATHLAGGWERAFQRRLPNVLLSFVRNATNMLDNFHKDAISYAREHFINLSGVSLLDQQLSTYKRRIQEIPAIVAGIIQDIQREANRSFEPVIEKDMQPAYEACTIEQGVGQYMRMKSHMRNHVDVTRHTMFTHAADTVRDQLMALCDTICKELWNQVLENIFKSLSRDYLSVLGGHDTKTVLVITRAERMLRGELSLMLAEDADKRFKDCLPAADTPAVDHQLPEEAPANGQHAAGGVFGTTTEARAESVDLGTF